MQQVEGSSIEEPLSAPAAAAGAAVAGWGLARRWSFSAKPASWPKLLVPAALGQALGVAASPEGFSAGAAAVGLAFTLLDLAFIVWLNDWADRRVDAIKRRAFPQAGGMKTIPDGVLPAGAVLTAACCAGALALAVAFAGGRWLDRPWLGGLGALCLVFFAAYSLPPLRLNYRGGGELLEAAGVGLLLPGLHAYAQSGRLLPPEAVALPGFVCLCLASAVASGLSDEESDRMGGKRTVVTLLGNRRARRVVEAAVLAGALLWGLAGALRPDALSPAAAAAGALLALFHLRRMRALSDAAGSGDFAGQRAYKGALHRAIWYAALALAALVAARASLG